MAEALARFRHVRPAVVAHCRSAADVASALARARTEGLAVAVRGGGHCFAGTSSTDGLLIDLAGLDGIRLEGDLAVIGGGATLGRIYDELETHGRTLNAGCGTTVGIGGLVLGGGLGILGRTYGTLSDRLRAAEVVLASGEIVRAGEELLWALRGAGQARFGVVTELAFATVEPPASTAFELLWAPEALPAVLHAWQRWAPEAPDAMAASLVVTAGERLQVKVFGSMAGSEAETSRTLAALCDAAGAPPRAAVHHPGSFREVKRFLAGPAEEERQDEPMWCKSEYVRDPLPDTAAEALVAHLHATAGRRSRPSSTSHPGPAPTPARRPRRRRSPTATPGSSSSTPSRSRQEPTRRPPAAGSPPPTPSPTRTAPAAPIPTSPTPTSIRGTRATTSATATAWSSSSAATTRRACSALRRDRPRLQDEDLVVLDRPLDVLRPAEPLLELEAHRREPGELVLARAHAAAPSSADSVDLARPARRVGDDLVRLRRELRPLHAAVAREHEVVGRELAGDDALAEPEARPRPASGRAARASGRS